MKRVLIAYSGGVDSTFLLKIALDTLGRENVLAVIAKSETFPKREFDCAIKIARGLGAEYSIIATRELDIKNFKNNPINRCYYCKKELFSKLIAISKKNGFRYVLDGANYDDLKDMRFGMQAARKLNVKSPLLEAKIVKDEIRKFSKALGLITWDKPSFACLSSRFPYGATITEDKLKMVDQAEDFLKGLGFKQVRVRYHDKMARIELYKDDIKNLFKGALLESVDKKLRSIGFDYVTIDLAGYRTGSMNEPWLRSHKKVLGHRS